MRTRGCLIVTMGIVYLFFSCNGGKKDKIEPLILPRDLPTISMVDSVNFKPEWYGNKYKVVVFVKNAGRYSTLDLNWNDPIKDFPEISVLFYISEKDSSKLVNHLREVRFSHPVIYDPEEVFYKKNKLQSELTFISFLLKDDVIVEMSNPSMPDFKERLERLLK